MSDNSNLGSVARKSRVIPLPDGTHIELRALVIADWACIQEEASHYARRDLIETYVRNADLIADVEERRAMVREAFTRAEAITSDTISDAKVTSWTSTIRGQLYGVWLSMRGSREYLTFDQASEYLAKYMELLPGISDAVAQISRPTIKNAEPPPPNQPATGESQDATPTTGPAWPIGSTWTAWAALRRWLSRS
jgi:hypothetical protein